MRDGQAPTIYLKDYQKASFAIPSLNLHFSLAEESVIVTNTLEFQRRRNGEDLVLDGEQLELIGLKLNDQPVSDSDHQVTDEQLVLKNLPDQGVLEIQTRIYPAKNTSLEGLYQSSGNFCTQCEAQGFRKITYHLDRPDVLSQFTTTIVGDKQKYPVLLSNGNCVDKGDNTDGTHWATWEDPFKKPAYLFALVAGDLTCIEDRFTTASGREVALEIYTEAHNADKCDHAMASLKRAMKWDEERFGLEYDLNIYMIVAVDDFNMGAMENKGLNVFNSKLVFASADTATDTDYINIEAVIGHEYFHNWTGNRVTCRDWFQLSLKEGLTVFRDQEFTSDLHSRSVKRIDDVALLRNHQFPEDAGPMAHPIRPQSYIEINNFYTVTVYEKGAEVVRLYHTLLGEEGFRRGMDLYFERHDGQAVTTEDFLAAMADANDRDLSQMQHWYDQAGTPALTIQAEYLPDEKAYLLHCSQNLPATIDFKPLPIPITLGLLDQTGQALQLSCDGKPVENDVLLMTKQSQTFRLDNIPETPVPSLLRGFSAPVALDFDYSPQQLAFLMRHDSDALNRWQAAQTLAIQSIHQHYQRRAGELLLATDYTDAFKTLLMDTEADPALIAVALGAPSMSQLIEGQDNINPQALYTSRKQYLQALGQSLYQDLQTVLQRMSPSDSYQIDADSMARRRLHGLCLSLLMAADPAQYAQTCLQQTRDANNFTDLSMAMGILNHHDCPERETAMAEFESRYSGNNLVMDKWFAMQASACIPERLSAIKALAEHVQFDRRNPNKLRSWLGAFAVANTVNFHADDGAGYQFVAAQIIALNEQNPQVAARLVQPLVMWKRYAQPYQAHMKQALTEIIAVKDLSKDVYEVVSKALA